MKIPESIGSFGEIVRLSDEKIIDYVVKLGGTKRNCGE